MLKMNSIKEKYPVFAQLVFVNYYVWRNRTSEKNFILSLFLRVFFSAFFILKSNIKAALWRKLLDVASWKS